MLLLQPETCELLEPCPYLCGRFKSSRFFLASGLSAAELQSLLETGWRKFGPYFFSPACPACRQCIPVRIPVESFCPSASQRRVLRRAAQVEFRFGPLRLDERGFAIYREHSRIRFGDEVDRDNFLLHFYFPAGPSRQSEYWLDGQQIGLGFLDLATRSLSSVYFCFDPEYSQMRLGTLSILREIEQARQLGLSHYYLGYYVPGSPRMGYKDNFHPREHYNWAEQRWFDPEATDYC